MKTKNLKIALFSVMLSLICTSCAYQDSLYGDMMREQMEKDGAGMGEWRQVSGGIWERGPK